MVEKNKFVTLISKNMKLKAGLWVFVLLMLSIATAHAQGLPCGGDDPDATCPLDTWVIVLVIASSIFVAFRLYRRQRSAPLHIR
ncbi:MAG: hypothetical protein JWP37_2060 [Mucilaginibacter sp.]|nr:hypothetical protein [Mucilaginibacter sp.]